MPPRLSRWRTKSSISKQKYRQYRKNNRRRNIKRGQNSDDRAEYPRFAKAASSHLDRENKRDYRKYNGKRRKYQHRR